MAKAKRLAAGWRRVVRRVLVIMVLVIAMPLVLTPIYGWVNPMSMPMIVRSLTGQTVERHWRGLDDISDRLQAAVVMSEDGQFCRHWGVDVGALRAEVSAVLAGEEARGASTLTMQVARNLFLWNGRSYARKALEVPLAVYLDLVLSKRRLLEIYLNIAEWGPDGEFGIDAGAQRAFGLGADSFSWRQASLLAVTLPNPHVRNPARPNRGLTRVSGIVEKRARNAGAYLGCLG